jgi:nicotinate-nucleotide pyrophosphorylase (carboxylating)
MLDDRLLEAIDQVVRAALEEDQADRDITTLAIIPPEAQGVARLVARQTCILAGVSAFTAVFNHIGGVKVEFSASNGDQVHGTVAHLSGSLRTQFGSTPVWYRNTNTILCRASWRCRSA